MILYESGGMGNIKIRHNHRFQQNAGRRWKWKIQNGVTKTKNNYIPTNGLGSVLYI